MKYTPKKILIVIAIISAPLVSFAADKDTAEPEYQLPEYKVEDLTLPVPSKVISPRLSGGLVGSEVRMRFKISAKGRAYGIHQVGISWDPNVNDLASAMTMALQSWEFEPGLDSIGNPTEVAVIMPVKVIRKDAKPTLVASLIPVAGENKES